RLDGVLERGQVGLMGSLRIAHRVDLPGREAVHEAERGEHLHVLLEERRRLLDPLLDAVGDVEREADAEIPARLGLASRAGARLAERVHDPLVGPALRRAAADDALDVVFRHEVERALTGADDRLPAFDRQRLWPGHERDLRYLVAAIRHRDRNRVVLALVSERALVERLENDLDLLLEKLA